MPTEHRSPYRSKNTRFSRALFLARAFFLAHLPRISNKKKMTSPMDSLVTAACGAAPAAASAPVAAPPAAANAPVAAPAPAPVAAPAAAAAPGTTDIAPGAAPPAPSAPTTLHQNVSSRLHPISLALEKIPNSRPVVEWIWRLTEKQSQLRADALYMLARTILLSATPTPVNYPTTTVIRGEHGKVYCGACKKHVSLNADGTAHGSHDGCNGLPNLKKRPRPS